LFSFLFFIQLLSLVFFSLSFFFYCHGHHRDLPSFPTRRSSDLSANPQASSTTAAQRSAMRDFVFAIRAVDGMLAPVVRLDPRCVTTHSMGGPSSCLT